MNFKFVAALLALGVMGSASAYECKKVGQRLALENPFRENTRLIQVPVYVLNAKTGKQKSFTSRNECLRNTISCKTVYTNEPLAPKNSRFAGQYSTHISHIDLRDADGVLLNRFNSRKECMKARAGILADVLNN